LRYYLLIIFFIALSGCGGDPQNSNLDLKNFIKPEYSNYQTSFKCNLVSGKTLNSVERFIPRFVNSFSKDEENSEELFFLFPLLNEGQIDTQSFKLVFNHANELSLDRFKLTLETLSFDQIAACDDADNLTKSLNLTSQNILDSIVISEILNCEYLAGFNYATLKLVIEQFTDALLKDDSYVDIFYSEAIDSVNQFQWTNIFLSLESRQDFVESWKSLEISREIQAMLLEQSICQPPKMYRRYRVI
tara:strand:- start:349 stop:1086 length:738 start_codon:yes stop_codon:yes gene_type:complete